jgi:hypothetical protein
MRKSAFVALGLLLGLVLGGTIFREPVVWAAQSLGATILGPLDAGGNVAVHEQGTAAVTVSNASVPVPVHEQGTVPAGQSGAWHMSIDGTPKVTNADATTLLGSFVGAPDGGGAFTEAVDADISGERSVRVMTNCFAGGDCANIAVNVYSIVGSRSYLIDQFPMQNFLSQTRVYDVLGEDLAVQLQNNNLAATSNIGVAVYGRAN